MTHVQSLTDRALRALTKPKPAAVAIFDTEVKQLQVRANASGTAVSFSVLKRPPGSRTLARFPVGTYPLTGLAEARAKAREVLREIENGVDPRVRKAEEARQAAAEKASTFAAVAEAFIARHVSKQRSARPIEQRIRRELIPRWGERPIASISRTDVVAMLDEIVDRGHIEAAHSTLACTKRLFGWAAIRYGLEHTPVDRVFAGDVIGPKSARERLLDARELKLIWQATEETPIGQMFGSYARLLLLLGVRRCELGEATWDEFDLTDDNATWTVPSVRMKAKAAHVIPLPPFAAGILRTLLRSGFLPRPGDRIFRGIHYGRMKRQLDARIKALNSDGKALPRWVWHDCRRTFRTGLSTIGIAPHIAELAIAHHQQGIRKVYDLHRYDDEKRAAFTAWERHLLSIVTPPPANVVPLRREA
jgi:integrase